MSGKLFKDESLSEKLIKKGFWLYFFTFLIAPSGYIIRVILSNDLSVSDIWLLYSIISFISIIAIYNDIWLTASLKYFLPKFWLEKKYDDFKTSIFIALFIQLTTWILLALLLYNWADYLWENYFHSEKAWQLLKIFCLYLVWINLYQVINKILTNGKISYYKKSFRNINFNFMD